MTRLIKKAGELQQIPVAAGGRGISAQIFELGNLA